MPLRHPRGVDSGEKLPSFRLQETRRRKTFGSLAFRGGNARSFRATAQKRPAAIIPRGGPNFCAELRFDINVKITRKRPTRYARDLGALRTLHLPASVRRLRRTHRYCASEHP